MWGMEWSILGKGVTGLLEGRTGALHGTVFCLGSSLKSSSSFLACQSPYIYVPLVTAKGPKWEGSGPLQFYKSLLTWSPGVNFISSQANSFCRIPLETNQPSLLFLTSLSPARAGSHSLSPTHATASFRPGQKQKLGHPIWARLSRRRPEYVLLCNRCLYNELMINIM